MKTPQSRRCAPRQPRPPSLSPAATSLPAGESLPLIGEPSGLLKYQLASL